MEDTGGVIAPSTLVVSIGEVDLEAAVTTTRDVEDRDEDFKAAVDVARVVMEAVVMALKDVVVIKDRIITTGTRTDKNIITNMNNVTISRRLTITARRKLDTLQQDNILELLVGTDLAQRRKISCRRSISI
jgi:hypothetical protein